MSESVKDLRLSKAKEILDEALAACDRLNRMPREILSELAANRLKWPVALVGSGGLTARGINAGDYVSGIGLGSSIPVDAKKPNSEVKLIVFEFIDFVHRAKENEGTEKPAPHPPAELIEMGFEDEYYKQQEEEWQREREARKLPQLNLETAGEWADAITNEVMDYACEFGIRKEVEIDGTEQLMTLSGLPSDVEKKVRKNREKLLLRKNKSLEARIRRANEKSALGDIHELWKSHFVGEAKNPASITKLERSAARETIGKVLRAIIMSPDI
jgi:hypothetical protein